MASYLRPRRGKQTTAVNQNIILKRGEVFFETPSSGVGTGIGKIKMGDGSTTYDNLPYFLEQNNIDVADTNITFTEATDTTNATLLTNMATGSKLNIIIGNIKRMLRKLDASVTTLSTSKSDTTHTHAGVYQPVGSYALTTHNHDSAYQAKGSYATTSHTHDDRYYTETEINTKLSAKADNWQKGTTAPTTLANNVVFFVYEP